MSIFESIMEEFQQPIDESKTDQIKIVKEKISNINRYIESLLNKKIRIDLKIKKQKTALKNLKNQASKELKLSLNLEEVLGEVDFPLTLEQYQTLKENTSEDLLEEAIFLDKELDQTSDLLSVIEGLPLATDLELGTGTSS